MTVIRGPRAATEDEQRAIDKHRAELQRQEQKRRKRNNQVAVLTMLLRPLVDLLRLVDHLKRTQPASEQTGRFLLTIAVRLLPRAERDRYLEEFRAELLDLPRRARLRYAWSLLRGIFVLRLRGDAKPKTADAAVRRAKD